MTRVGDGARPVPPGPGDQGASPDARLRQAARQLTGLFAQQLFKAMRETVPTDQGIVSGGSGEEMFTGMLDEHLAGAGPAAAHARVTEGLADAVYRRLRTVSTASTAGAPAPAAVTPPAAPASLVQPPPPLGPLDRR